MYVEAIWMTLWCLCYFCGVATSDRNLLWPDFSDSRFDILQKKGPVSILSLRVIVSTFLCCSPLWFEGLFKNTTFHAFLLYISLICFFSPLLLPSKMAPSSRDMGNGIDYTVKWVQARLDWWVRCALVIGLGSLLTYIPIVKILAANIANTIFPFIGNNKTEELFKDLLPGSILLFLISYLFRLSMLLVNGYLLTLAYSFSIVLIYMEYQWLLNETYFKNYVSGMLGLAFLAKTFLDFYLDSLLNGVEIGNREN